MSEWVISVLPIVLPVFLGAVIGYVTNYIAIRMLFRPLTEKRVLGIRVPLTPGIIPKQRYQLAESIGRMVSAHLLTEETVRRHIASEKFYSSLERGIGNFTESFMSRPVGFEPSDTYARTFDRIEEWITLRVPDLLRSSEFKSVVDHAVVAGIDTFMSSRLADVLPGEGSRRRFLERLLSTFSEGELRRTILDVGHEWLNRQLTADAPMQRFLTDGVVSEIARVMVGVYDPTLEHILRWLNRPDVRRELSVRGKTLLRRVLEKLTVMQRFFVTAAQYDRQLEEKMPEIVDDIIGLLSDAGRDPANKERIIQAGIDAMKQIQAQGMREAAAVGNINIPQLFEKLLDHVAGVVDRPEVRDQLIESVERSIERNGHRSVEEILAGVAEIRRDQAVEYLVGAVDSWLQKKGTTERLAEELRSAVHRFRERLQRESLQRILRIPTRQKRKIDQAATRQVALMVERRLPQVLETLDVQQLVVDRVNSLDVKRVEDLLLMVIARHLKWINLFGALLGAVIGGSQVILRYIV
ncbi:MAG: DUF445 family protein [Spirochaetota bacterium]